MIILLIIGIVLTGLAAAIVIRGVLWRSSETSAGLLRRIDKYGFDRRARDSEGRGGVRDTLDDVAAKLGSVFAAKTGARGTQQIARDLVAAGLYNMTPGKFMGYRVLCTIGVPILWIWFVATAGLAPALAVISTLFIGFLGWFLPGRFLQQRAQQRLKDIDYQLPELIDLLVVTVEAGLGFVGSLQMASGRVKGALGQELRLTLQEQSMGLSIQEALMNMNARIDTASTRSFVRSVVQGETLGVSIGQIMRDLANEMRRRRRADAQERAQKAPIKILFPLVLLIFPAMFVVLLGPALLLMFKAFSGG
jgi:tight adherence protein C